MSAGADAPDSTIARRFPSFENSSRPKISAGSFGPGVTLPDAVS
jgi:hypothetical protein